MAGPGRAGQKTSQCGAQLWRAEDCMNPDIAVTALIESQMHEFTIAVCGMNQTCAHFKFNDLIFSGAFDPLLRPARALPLPTPWRAARALPPAPLWRSTFPLPLNDLISGASYSRSVKDGSNKRKRSSEKEAEGSSKRSSKKEAEGSSKKEGTAQLPALQRKATGVWSDMRGVQHQALQGCLHV